MREHLRMLVLAAGALALMAASRLVPEQRPSQPPAKPRTPRRRTLPILAAAH